MKIPLKYAAFKVLGFKNYFICHFEGPFITIASILMSEENRKPVVIYMGHLVLLGMFQQ